MDDAQIEEAAKQTVINLKPEWITECGWTQEEIIEHVFNVGAKWAREEDAKRVEAYPSDLLYSARVFLKNLAKEIRGIENDT